jgi:Family of unknown function (DUF5522)
LSRQAPALVEGEDFYMENGHVVFTALYHLRRGRCCGSGCRHCPYGGEEGEAAVEYHEENAEGRVE